MKWFTPLLLTLTLFTASCIEKSSPGPVNSQGKTHPGGLPGDWESSGVDEPLTPEGLPEVVMAESVPVHNFGLACFEDEQTAQSKLNLLHNYTELEKEVFHLQTLETFSLFQNDPQWKVWTEIKDLLVLDEMMEKLLERLQKFEPNLYSIVRENIQRIHFTPLYLNTKKEEIKPAQEIPSECLYFKLAERNESSPTEEQSLIIESFISEFVFDRLSLLDQASLILHEAIQLALLNSGADAVHDVRHTVMFLISEEEN